jgi:hypothetical protein
VVVDRQMQIFPARSQASGAQVALPPPIASDAMADAVDTTELF